MVVAGLIVRRCAGREHSEMISFPYLKEDDVGEKNEEGRERCICTPMRFLGRRRISGSASKRFESFLSRRWLL